MQTNRHRARRGGGLCAPLPALLKQTGLVSPSTHCRLDRLRKLKISVHTHSHNSASVYGSLGDLAPPVCCLSPLPALALPYKRTDCSPDPTQPAGVTVTLQDAADEHNNGPEASQQAGNDTDYGLGYQPDTPPCTDHPCASMSPFVQKKKDTVSPAREPSWWHSG